MATAGRAARCCIRSSNGLSFVRAARPSNLLEFSRAVSTATPPPTSTPKKTTTTPTQKRPAPSAKAPYNRRPASNGNTNTSPKPAIPSTNNNGNKTSQPPKQAQAPSPTAPLPTVRTSKHSPAQDKAAIDDQSPIKDMSNGLADTPITLDEGSNQVDWSSSFHGLSAQPFSQEAAAILLADIEPDDVEVKPDGIVYLPEIKYRRILNRAFGPGGWGLAPRGETIVTGKSVTREYALVAHGRLVSVARGEQQYFSPEGIPTATEGCKSNALMRCCKDLGVASELWDPRFIRKFMKSHAKQIWVEHVPTKKKKQIWLRLDDEPKYPFKETKFGA